MAIRLTKKQLADITAGKPLSQWRNEHEFQRAVIAMCDRLGGLYALVYAIPNGQVRPGQRVEAGLRAGMPDLCLPVPSASGEYHALFIELKITGGNLSQAQKDKLFDLRNAGNKCVVVWDGLHAVEQEIAEYLGKETA